MGALADVLKDEMALLNTADRSRTRRSTLEYVDGMDRLLQRKLSLVLGLRASLSGFMTDYGCSAAPVAVGISTNAESPDPDELLEDEM